MRSLSLKRRCTEAVEGVYRLARLEAGKHDLACWCQQVTGASSYTLEHYKVPPQYNMLCSSVSGVCRLL